MDNNQYYRTLIFTGLIFFVFSWFLIITGIFFLPDKFFSHRFEASALVEKQKVMKSRLARQEEDARKLNEEVVRANNQLNTLILESREINNRISRWLEVPLTNQAVRDSIDFLYKRQINQIEPSIDSVGAVFNNKTGVLLEKLALNRELEKDVFIAGSEEEMLQYQMTGILVLGGFIVVSALAGISGGIILMRGGFRKWKNNIHKNTETSSF